MAEIFPFRAFRYDPALVPVDRVVTQPYDKITPAMQASYVAAHPANLVRIILGKPEVGDSDNNNVYTRAASYFHQWRGDGILRPDAEPSIYLYSQQFCVPGAPAGTPPQERRGFIAAGRIYDYSNGVIFRHEQTLSKPKADRLNLLRATRAHFGQIFMIYSDPRQQVEAILSPSTEADTTVRDEYGVLHRLWKISDPQAIAAVQQAMQDKKLIIADGHHRYETALTYRNECRASTGSTDVDAPYKRVMMTLVNMDAPGLVILPTHRVVFGLTAFDRDLFLRGAWAYFETEKIPSESNVSALMQRLADAGRERTAIVALIGHDAYLLRARPGASDALLSSLSEQQRQLDLVQLHKVLLEHVLGISEDAIREQRHINYVRDSEEAIQRARTDANVVFLVNPVRVEQVRDIAFAGEVLPQKSTDFYPKMLSGLTIYALE